MSVMSPLTDRARSGGGAYSGRMTEQSLTVQRSCRVEGGSAPESVAIRGLQTVIFKIDITILKQVCTCPFCGFLR